MRIRIQPFNLMRLADPDPTYKLDAEPDPEPNFKFDEDPCGSGSATLLVRMKRQPYTKIADPHLLHAEF
jgi:hypothetical protein